MPDGPDPSSPPTPPSRSPENAKSTPHGAGAGERPPHGTASPDTTPTPITPIPPGFSSPSPLPESRPSPKKPVLKWLLGSLLILCVLFHRPLLHFTLQTLLERAAQKDGLALHVHLSGNGFNHLALDALEIIPSPSDSPLQPAQNHSGIRAVHVNKAELHYSLARLFWSGPGECIRSYAISGASFELGAPSSPGPVPTAPTAQVTHTSSFAKTLEKILAQPSLYADSVQISDLNVEIESSSTLRSIHGLNLTALPDKTGTVQIAGITLGNGTSFENWSAKTTYPQRHLEITGLTITPDLELEILSFDASQRSLGKSRAQIRLRYKNGHISAALLALKANTPANPKNTPDLHLELSAAHFPAQELARLIGWKLPVSEIEWAESHVQGDPHTPSSWRGQADLRATTDIPLPDPTSPYCEPLTSELHAAFQSGTFHLDSFSAYSGTTTSAASGKIRLPSSLDKLEQTEGAIRILIQSEDISTWGALIGIPPQSPLSGTANISGDLTIADGLGIVRAQGTSTTANSGPIQYSEASAQLDLKIPLQASTLDLAHATGGASLLIKTPCLQIPWASLSLEHLTANVSLQNAILSLDKLALSKASNKIEATAETPLFASTTAPLTPSKIQVQAECPNLDQLDLRVLTHRVTGNLHAHLAGQILQGKWTGPIDVSAKPIIWGGFDLGELKLHAALSDNHLDIQDLLLGWTKNERIQISGSTDLSAPRAYQIKSDVQLSRLERLAPLLKQSGFDSDIGGSLEAQWNGLGTMQPLGGTGTWRLAIKNAHWKALILNEALCAGTYAPGQWKAGPVRITTPHARLNSKILWSEDTLRIQEIALEQWGYPTLSGFLILPLLWDHTGAHWNDTGSLSGQLNATGLDLVSLFTAAGVPAPVSGAVKLTLNLSGTPLTPEAAFTLSGRELRLPSIPNVGTSEFDLSGRYSAGNFESDAVLRSGLQSPVSFQLKFPAPLKDLFLGKSPPSQTPIQARLQTTKANLKLLPALLPGFKKVEGTFSLELNVGGTIQNPTWKGALHIDSPVTHFVSYRFPAITDLHSHIEFDGNDFRMKSLRADLGGGTLNIDGAVHLGDKKTTTLDFHVIANQVLLIRSRDLLLRLNGDLRLRGPWHQASISGTGFATKSRVTKDIDLVPINALKKAPLALPKPGLGKPWFTLSKAPFADWKFDIRLHTRPEDPILIRGNRLHGSAFADLTLKGTGAALTLEGDYKTTDMVAYLPFAKIEVSRGHVWYFPDRPFLPQLDFSAEAEVRNHRVRLYITGTPEIPRITLNSDPPLNETDLLTLLTTGVLPGDTSENGQALAGRAAAVLFQELSGKVLNSSSGGDRLSALRRFTLDVGSLNSRTGHQESKLTYQMSDNFFMIGELGANGDFGGQIKYLIRFR